MTSSLSYLVGQTLTWVPTATFKSSYSLMAPNNTTLATLDMSNWSSKAHASVPEGTLFMNKEGWTGLKIAIYTAEQGPLVATYQRKWSSAKGQISFPDGRTFNWDKVNFWGTQKAWVDSTSKTPYVQFTVRSFSRQSPVVIHPQAAVIPELSLLLVLGLYNIHIENQESVSSSATIATTGI
jgi:hypothetical protein